MRTLVRGGRVVVGQHVTRGDVLLDGGRVTAVGAVPELAVDRVLDATGAYVLPGLIDLHVHLDDRIGRFYLADDYASGTAAAVLNGVTTVGSFVTQESGESLAAAMARARAKADGHSHADLFWHLTPTTFADADLAFLRSLPPLGYRTVKLYTTYRDAGIYTDWERMARLFETLTPAGIGFLVHCESDELLPTTPPESLDLGTAAAHARLRGAHAEADAIARVADLAAATGARVHVVHVSSPEGAAAVAAGRRGGALTCETCPQYLWLDEGYLARPDGHRWMCTPPLRPDPAAQRALARAGGFDVLATDHCPFRRADKDDWDGRDVRTVANGLPGVGALTHLAWAVWADDPDAAALALGRHLAAEPARVAGLSGRKGTLAPGMDADVVVLDPAGPSRSVRATRADAHDPYPGFTSPLAFRHVVRRGEVVVADDRLVAPDHPGGRLLQAAPPTPLTDGAHPEETT